MLGAVISLAISIVIMVVVHDRDFREIEKSVKMDYCQNFLMIFLSLGGLHYGLNRQYLDYKWASLFS